MSKRKSNDEIATNYSADKIAYLKKAYPNCNISLEKICKKLDMKENVIYSLAHRLGLKRRNSWTQKEDEYLKNSYIEMGVSVEDIAEKLNGRTIYSINRRIYNLGLHRFNREFTQTEINFISNAKHLGIRDIANHLGIKINDVKHFLAKKDGGHEICEVKKNRWTDSDDAYLKLNLPNPEIPVYEIADKLGRSLNSVWTRAFILGIKRERIDLWTKEEDEYLKANYENKDIPMEQIFEYLKHRPRGDIYRRTKRLGLKRTSFKLTQSDFDIIINQKDWRIKDIAAYLGVSISTVNYYLAKNNIKRNVGGKKGTWTNEQREYLKTHYPNKSIEMAQITEYLGRSAEAVRYQAKLLGLSRPLGNK